MDMDAGSYSVFVVVNHTRRELYVGAGAFAETWDSELRLERRAYLPWERICEADQETTGHWDLVADRTKLIVSRPVRSARQAVRLARRLRADHQALALHCQRVLRLTADGYVVLAATTH